MTDLEKAPSALSAPVEAAAAPPNISSTSPPDDYPDGGWRAWLVVAGGWSISFISWGFVNSYGVFLDYYTSHQLADKSPSSIAFIGAFQLFSVLFCAVGAGRAFDFGKLRWIMAAATLIYAAGLFGLANSTTYAEIFLAQGFACGVGAGLAFLPAVSCVPHWFRRRRAFALGILATGSSVGGIVYPIMINRLLYRIGFPNTVRAVGGLTVALLVFATFALKTRLPVRKSGAILNFAYFKDAEYTLLSAGVLCAMTGLYTPYFYLQEYAARPPTNVSQGLSFYGLAILNGASLAGRVIMNALADRYGALTILIPNMFLSGALIFVWLAAGRNVAGFIIFDLLFGFVSGALVSMIPACIAACAKDMREIGVRMTLLFMVESLAGLAGTPIAGALLHRTGGYVAPACFSGGIVLLGSLFLVGSRHFVSREKGTWKV